MQPSDKVSTKNKFVGSLITGVLCSAFAWMVMSLEPGPYQESEEEDFEEGAIEYSNPEFLSVPSSLLKNVNDDGDILVHWTDSNGRSYFKTEKRADGRTGFTTDEGEML